MSTRACCSAAPRQSLPDRMDRGSASAGHRPVRRRAASHLADAVGVVEQHAQVADPPHAGVEAGRGLTGLDPRETKDALLRFSRGPVVVGLLVGARGHAGPPRPAPLLVQEHDAVFAPLVQGRRRAGRHASRVEAVIADPRQVEEDQLLDGEKLLPLLGRVSPARFGSLAA